MYEPGKIWGESPTGVLSLTGHFEESLASRSWAIMADAGTPGTSPRFRCRTAEPLGMEREWPEQTRAEGRPSGKHPAQEMKRAWQAACPGGGQAGLARPMQTPPVPQSQHRWTWSGNAAPFPTRSPRPRACTEWKEEVSVKDHYMSALWGHSPAMFWDLHIEHSSSKASSLRPRRVLKTGLGCCLRLRALAVWEGRSPELGTARARLSGHRGRGAGPWDGGGTWAKPKNLVCCVLQG